MSETTIVTPPAQDTGVSGLIISLVIVALVLIGGFVWYRYYSNPAPAQAGDTNIQVTVPTPVTNTAQ